MTTFTAEQSNVIALYKRDTREETMKAIDLAMGFLLDKDSQELFAECISDLLEISDEEFAAETFSIITG